jgi:GDP-L-fucose synthase
MAADAEFRLEGKRVWIAGHRGMLGSALLRRLRNEPCELLTVERASVDLTRQAETEDWIAETRPDAIFLAAAHVGGILANDAAPADFLYDNLLIEANVLRAAHLAGVAKLLVLGSSCIYPRLAPQPIGEDALLSGPLEPTNEAYAVAKIAGLKLADAYRRQHGRDFISAMPTNLYGPNDNFDLSTSHVLAALIRKAHDAMRPAAPRVFACRRLRRRPRALDATLLGGPPHQCRLGGGNRDQRPGKARRRYRRLPRWDRIRHDQA